MTVSNKVFMGCNYNDKKIKAQFDNLKKRLELDTPLRCEIIDKRAGKPARDLWQDIKTTIEESAVCIFDVSGFRPNVVLELGYALSIKAEDQLFITFRKRKTSGNPPKWFLSDIAHLQRHEYISLADLEHFIRDQLDQVPYGKRFTEFLNDCSSTAAPDKYKNAGLKVIQSIRDNGTRSEQQVAAVMTGTGCHFAIMAKLLKRNQIAIRTRGRNGRFYIPTIQ